jgi:hypothetical protein
MITPDVLATQICQALNLPSKEHAESLDVILRPALTDACQPAVLAAKTECLEIAEDEAERCRSVGATTAQQTALNIARAFVNAMSRSPRRLGCHCPVARQGVEAMGPSFADPAAGGKVARFR